MSDMNGKYKQIMKEFETKIKDAETLELVKERFSDLSTMFMDMLDRVTSLTANKIQIIQTRQQEIFEKIVSIQAAIDGIESDIYEDEDKYEFEIVCPYCNYEFKVNIEEESKEEIQCPECHNTIELDWNLDEEFTGCPCDCSCCETGCEVPEEKEKEKYELKNVQKNRKQPFQEEEDDKEDM